MMDRFNGYVIAASVAWGFFVVYVVGATDLPTMLLLSALGGFAIGIAFDLWGRQ